MDDEYEDDGDLPPTQPMPRRRRPDDEPDSEAKRHRDEVRAHDGVMPNGRRSKGRSRRVEWRRHPRNRRDQSGPPR